MGILREYSQGPFKWLVSSVELLPRPGGGTTLIHSLQLEPSHVDGSHRLALGGGRRPAEEPREGLSPHRRDLAESAPSRDFARSRSLRGAALGCRPRAASDWIA